MEQTEEICILLILFNRFYEVQKGVGNLWLNIATSRKPNHDVTHALCSILNYNDGVLVHIMRPYERMGSGYCMRSLRRLSRGSTHRDCVYRSSSVSTLNVQRNSYK